MIINVGGVLRSRPNQKPFSIIRESNSRGLGCESSVKEGSESINESGGNITRTLCT